MSELGSKLREARIERGYTLNTLQQMTKIQKKYLQAIEEGNYEEMPGDFYVRAFIKQYADMVGLNGSDLLEEYEAELKENAEQAKETQPQETPSDLPSRKERFGSDEKSNLEILMGYAPLFLLVLAIIMIMIMLILAINRINQANEQEANLEERTPSIVSVLEPESVASESSKESLSEASTSQENQPALGENDIQVGDAVLTRVTAETGETAYQLNGPFSAYEFEVRGNAYVWVGIVEDDMMVVDTTMSADDTLEHKASSGVSQVRIRLGYPEGADIYVNGEKVESPDPYIQDSILFIAADQPASEQDESSSNETIDLNIPEDDTNSNQTEATSSQEEYTGYQGPAVYAPNY